jgi:type I restriction enzyme R subunit
LGRAASEYAKAKLKYLNNDPLPFVFESTGTITRFRDTRDPKPRGRNIFWFYRPETLAEWLQYANLFLRTLLPAVFVAAVFR